MLCNVFTQLETCKMWKLTRVFYWCRYCCLTAACLERDNYREISTELETWKCANYREFFIEFGMWKLYHFYWGRRFGSAAACLKKGKLSRNFHWARSVKNGKTNAKFPLNSECENCRGFYWSRHLLASSWMVGKGKLTRNYDSARNV